MVFVFISIINTSSQVKVTVLVHREKKENRTIKGDKFNQQTAVEETGA